MAKTGIRKRHSRACPGGDCRCSSWEASIWSARDGKKLRKTFASEAAARSWRNDTGSALSRGTLRAPTRETVKQAGERWLADAKSGTIRLPSGSRYKPSVLRGYESDLTRFVFKEIGHIRLSELRRRDVQKFVVDELVRRGLSGSRVRGAVMPLRAICRRALRDEELGVNPTSDLDIPASAGARDRVATVDEANKLLDALQVDDRALWATAMFAGLRRGELRALRWSNIDDGLTVITVEHGWDDVAGEIAPKSAKGKRTVPIAGALRLILLEQKARMGRRDGDLVFGQTATRPFTPTNARLRALRAWAKRYQCGCDVDLKDKDPLRDADGQRICSDHRVRTLTPIGLHECRHTFVSLMADAGFPLEQIGDYVGHSSTFMVDRYRHLLDGHEAAAAARFDQYLTGARTGAHPDPVSLQAARSGRN